MPDHLHLPAPGQPPTWRDHLAAHPMSVTLLIIVLCSALLIVADAATSHTLLPSLTPIPPWVQATLGALLVVGVVLALMGTVWRPKPLLRGGQTVLRVDASLALERLGWLIVAIASLGVTLAIARTGPWVLATMLPITWSIQALGRAVSLTIISRRRRSSAARVASLRIVP